ncbi:MAG: PIN domain-containing protein [Anaerolineales bacterium]|nr:PIN domain-containing protein [Anaerolineales bacterium]
MNGERLFADTNLFLRYLTNDLPDQADAFEQVLQAATRGQLTLVTNAMVIAEIVWTLESFYRLTPLQTQERVLAIFNTPGLEVADGDLALQAILWHVEKNVDFIDAYNVAWMRQEGLSAACTFDRRHFARFDDLAVKVPGEDLP